MRKANARGGGHGEVSQFGQVQGQIGQVQVKVQVQVHWNQGYQRGAGATTDASSEAQWLAEGLSGSEGLVSGRGRRSITLLHDRLN